MFPRRQLCFPHTDVPDLVSVIISYVDLQSLNWISFRKLSLYSLQAKTGLGQKPVIVWSYASLSSLHEASTRSAGLQYDLYRRGPWGVGCAMCVDKAGFRMHLPPHHCSCSRPGLDHGIIALLPPGYEGLSALADAKNGMHCGIKWSWTFVPVSPFLATWTCFSHCPQHSFLG